MLQPLGSHHLLLVVPRYTFIKLFLLHLRPPSHSMYIISFSRASRTSAGLLTYVVCVRACECAGLCTCAAACVGVFWKMGEGEGRGGDVAISVLQNAHYPSQAKQLVRARACARLPAMVLAGVQECAENPLLGTGRNARGGREEGVACNSATSDTAAVTGESLKGLGVARRWESVRTGRLKKKKQTSLSFVFFRPN